MESAKLHVDLDERRYKGRSSFLRALSYGVNKRVGGFEETAGDSSVGRNES
jgi:hypothetical protein